MVCIFERKPDPLCSACLDSMKLQCLLNKSYWKVTAEGKKELTKMLKENLNSGKRVE